MTQQLVTLQAGHPLVPQCRPATEPAPPTGLFPFLHATPAGALVHVQGLITAVSDNRHRPYCRVTISDTTGSAVVHFADDITPHRKSELKVGRALGVIGCVTSAEVYDVLAAKWQTADVSMSLT